MLVIYSAIVGIYVYVIYLINTLFMIDNHIIP
jgi:hypothetical protein